LPTIYGERESAHRLIPYTVKALKYNEALKFTSGNQVRQYLYIDDLPHILFSLINNGSSGIFNLPGSETFTVRQLVKKVFDFYGKEFSEEIFGSVQRADVGMLNLQMNGDKLNNEIPSVSYSNFSECLKRYDLCL
jgi:nucleoside-diphosphate-sugar epimerase